MVSLHDFFATGLWDFEDSRHEYLHVYFQICIHFCKKIICIYFHIFVHKLRESGFFK